METFEEHAEKWKLYLTGLIKWFLLSVTIGALCGVVGSVFHISVHYVTKLRGEYPWILYLLPVLGILILLIYKGLKAEGMNTDSVLEAIHSGKNLAPGLLPAIFFSTILTHLGGGSAGREGAALQMGGTIGHLLGKTARLDDRDLRTATMTGMAAFFSALFGTPVAATVFAMAVVSVGLLYHAALFPSLTAALTAYGISRMMGVEPTRFHIQVPAVDAVLLVRVAVFSCLCALVSILFCICVHETGHLMQRYLKNEYLRIVAGGCVIAGLSVLLRTTDYNGAGMNIITAAVEQGRAVPWAFLLKILFTAVTLAAGYKGGEVVPALFVGATFGCVTGPLLGLPAGFAGAIGMIAVFCGAVNCPLATIFLSIELFGSEGLLCFALACSLSYILSGYYGLYSSQRILYDKLKARYINVYSNAYHEGQEGKEDTVSR